MLTVQDIQAQQFHVRFRGFDVEEVDEFLEQAAAALQAAEEENSRLKEQLTAAERKVAAYKRQEQASMSALISAQKIAEEMKEKARNESKELLEQARREARGLEESAGREISDLEREVDRLRAMKGEIREELRLVLESYLAQLEGDHLRASAPAGAAKGATVAGAGSEQPSADDDLYRRIELPDELEPPGEPGSDAGLSPEPLSAEPSVSPQRPPQRPPQGPPQGPPPTPTPSPVSEEESTLPDLDGDMVFTLEDPLDEEDDSADSGPDLTLEDKAEPAAKS